MCGAGLILTFSAIVPLLAAANANRSTSLVHTHAWAIVAWAVWTAAVVVGSTDMGYLALALTGCAGVAVLGARRPGAAAWNFVVTGLLIVLALPLAQAAALGTTVRPGTIVNIFLISLLAVTLINYLPTRLGGGAAALAVGCGWAFRCVVKPTPVDAGASLCIGLAPWLAWAGLSIRPTAAGHAWQSFRDRYGLIWSLRLREQFNRAAANAGLASRFEWKGVRPPDPAADELLTALTKRFV